MAMVRRRRKNRRRGLATVEMAMVLWLLLVLTLGMLRYGWLFLKTQQITNAARNGARIAILPGVTVVDDVEPAILNLMTAAGMGASGYSVTITPPDLGSAGIGSTVTVLITVPRAAIDIMDLALLPAPESLGAKVTMAKEGP